MKIRSHEELEETSFSTSSSMDTPRSGVDRIDAILSEKFDMALRKPNSKVRLHDFAKIASEHSPIDLAYAVSRLPPYMRPALYENLPNRDAKVKFIINTDRDTRLGLFRRLSDTELKKIFDRMPVDEAVWVIEDLSERRFRRLMAQIDAKKAIRIRDLRTHEKNSAGRLMTAEFFAFPIHMTIGEVAVQIRENPRIDFQKGIFILNQAGELQGYVSSRNMMIHSSQTPLRQVMGPVLYKVTAEASREEVIDLVERYKISSLPVVDSENALIGVITHQDVVEAIEDLADEMIAHMGGTGEKSSSHEPVFKRFLIRAPWLIITLFAGLVNMSVMSSFQKNEGGVLTFVLFFVPLITGMSGNIGLQCSTVLIRSMALGGLSSSGRKDAVMKELFCGLFTGVCFGVGCGFLIFFLDLVGGGVSLGGVSPLAVGVIVGVGLIGGCLVGTFLGVFSPLFFSRVGVDPAIAAGPIVTACNDFLSMAIYFLIAWAVSSLFLGFL